jgi:hypothetical protein
MYSLAICRILAAGAPDDEKPWVQLLVFVLFAIFYAVGGILKARSAKKQQKPPQAPPRQQVPHARSRLKVPVPPPTPNARKPHTYIPTSTPVTAQPQAAEIPAATRPEVRIGETLVPAFPELYEAEGLQKAIVYREVLGLPVSLRNPRDGIAGC